MFTLGGLVVDEDTGAVTTPTGESIPGLYAAGRTVIGFSGRRAAEHAVQQSPVTP
ncbi:MAG TPA: FAD-binding protein [Mycobacterium sp.]|nr:FAD-binding protein [Mycobacterium sp.]